MTARWRIETWRQDLTVAEVHPTLPEDPIARREDQLPGGRLLSLRRAARGESPRVVLDHLRQRPPLP